MFDILKTKKNNKKIYRTHTFDPIDYDKFSKMCKKRHINISTALQLNMKYITQSALPIDELIDKQISVSK